MVPAARLTIFEIKSVTEDDRFVERESRGGAIPRHKLIDRMPITALRFERSQAYDHGDLGVLQIGNAQLTSDRNSAYATGDGPLGRGDRGSIPLHLILEAKKISLSPGTSERWEITLSGR